MWLARQSAVAAVHPDVRWQRLGRTQFNERGCRSKLLSAGFERIYACRRCGSPQNEQRALDTLLRERRSTFRSPSKGRRSCVKIAQSQAEPLRVLLCTCEKTRRALLRAARPRRAAAEPCRQAIGSHSSQRRPWRRRPERLRAKACHSAPRPLSLKTPAVASEQRT